MLPPSRSPFHARHKWGSHGRDTEAVVATKYLSAMLPPVRFYGRNMEAVVATKYLHTAPHRTNRCSNMLPEALWCRAPLPATLSALTVHFPRVGATTRPQSSFPC